MKRLFPLALLALLACDGDNAESCISSHRDTFHDVVLCDASETPKFITFMLSGQAACRECSAKAFPVAGLYVNVFPADASKLDVLDPIATTMTGGLGPFELRLTAEEGVKLRVDGQLYRESSDILNPTTMASSIEITAPGEDGEIVAFTLNFPEE